MLGFPKRGEPVFMKSFAGPWLKTSVAMLHTMQMSSAMEAIRGRSSLTSAPLRPCLEKVRLEARSFLS